MESILNCIIIILMKFAETARSDEWYINFILIYWKFYNESNLWRRQKNSMLKEYAKSLINITHDNLFHLPSKLPVLVSNKLITFLIKYSLLKRSIDNN